MTDNCCCTDPTQNYNNCSWSRSNQFNNLNSNLNPSLYPYPRFPMPAYPNPQTADWAKNANNVWTIMSFNALTTENSKENNMFDKILSRAKDGMFRISMNGDIAVQTDNGYKTFDAKTKKLVNCSDFIFDVGDEWFFVVPATKVKEGDIILVNDKPKCVISVDELISVLNFENSTVEQIVPERHLFMGNVYFYSKVKSMFGHGKKGKKNPLKKIMKWKLMSQMFKGNDTGINTGFSIPNDLNKLMAYSMFMKDNDDFMDMFEDMFDFDEDDLDIFPENKDENKEE